MGPRFLLDEHFSPALAAAAVRAGLDVTAVVATDLRGRDDLRVLKAAVSQDRILVTYDLADFRPLLSEMVWAGIKVPGLVAVNSRTFRSNDLKGLRKALIRLAERIVRGEVDPSMGVTLTR
jgi:predicted nuclease of predicted toxin-antitoxin system